MHSRAEIRASGATERCAFQQVRLAGHQASSEARGDVCSLSWSGGRFDVRAEREHRHYTMSLSSCSEGCGYTIIATV